MSYSLSRRIAARSARYRATKLLMSAFHPLRTLAAQLLSTFPDLAQRAKGRSCATSTR